MVDSWNGKNSMALKRYLEKNRLEVGCDEAGRGCLAGPVFAAAVILNPDKPIQGLDDSKQLSETRRDSLRLEIEEKALAWAVASLSPAEIDKVNILKASFLSMHKALQSLSFKPEHILVDGNRFIPFPSITHTCIVKGDAKFQSIAAASILAKTYRDEYMLKIHDEFPMYSWNQNKGYPTTAHREAIRQHGPCKHHRMSFRLLNEQLTLF
ncbi:MAG: ribonuclease HII [Bacteroidia bacterium]|nr:ribonuclease HII [Bacteroidia bacterium]